MVEATEDVPHGFLFLCPTKDFRTGPWSFRWPNNPVYWAADPSGVVPLSSEEAVKLGFPQLELSASTEGIYLDSTAYAGLRQFHEAKGFDPYSQDVARYLGYPLYRLSTDTSAPFAHIDDTDTEFAEDVQDSPMDVDENEGEECGNEDTPVMDLSW
ncbi:hypothetical protein DFH06DRAFT_749147 [Mycena polygramma]|nr:hypothetical protein DFH06DRAFT_749147 [Mycena polygramma]